MLFFFLAAKKERPEESAGGYVLYGAWQVRAVLPVGQGRSALCKGMLKVNPDLPGLTFHLRDDCCKMTWDTCPLAPIGFILSGSMSQGHHKPSQK